MDPTIVMLGVSTLIFLLSRRKRKGDGDPLPPPPAPGPAPEPPVPGGGPRPGDKTPPNGKRVPKTQPGGTRYGDPDKDYTIPANWDAVRGIWFSPDCKVIVEAPAWFCGQAPNGAIQIYPGSFSCTVIEKPTYAETMAVPKNGVAGYVDYLISKDFDPNLIAWTILEEAAPACWDLEQKDWPPALVYWWNYLLERLYSWYEDSTGIPFDPPNA